MPGEAAEHLEQAVEAYWKALPRVRGDARGEVGACLVDTALEAAEAMCRAADARAVGTCRQALRAAKTAAPERAAEVQIRMKQIGHRVRLQKEVGGLAKRLEQDPQDTGVATKLVRTLVIDLDQPARADPPRVPACSPAYALRATAGKPHAARTARESNEATAHLGRGFACVQRRGEPGKSAAREIPYSNCTCTRWAEQEMQGSYARTSISSRCVISSWDLPSSMSCGT